jgi:ketosteroid isomerase-like protein
VTRFRWHLRVVCALAIAAARPLAAQAAGPSATERALFALEDQFAQAVVKRDAATLRRMVAPRWVYSDESGVMEREAGVRAFTSGADTVTQAGNDRMRALVYGGTAVVIGELWMKGRGPSGAFTHRYRYTDTWVRLDGRWRCVASQDYLMPEPGR